MRRVLRDGVEIYRVGHRSLGEFLADLREEIRAQGWGRGSLRALFRGVSEWAYLIGAYPTGGWEFVDFLVHEADSPRGLDRWLLKSAFVKGIQNRAAFVRDELERQLRARALQREIRVLDVGCGIGTFGFYALECAQKLGLEGRVRAVGIDRDPRAIALARELAQARGFASRIDWKRGDALKHLERTPERYDIALLIGVLAYLPDPRAIELLSAIRARLQTDGALLASHLHPRAPRAVRAWLRLLGVDLRARTPQQLERLLRAAGFSRVNVTQDATGTQNLLVAGAGPPARPSAPSLDGRGLGEVVWVDAERLRDHEEVEPERVEQLVRALRERKRVKPVLVEKEHKVVLDGHHRKAALEHLGFREVPCVLVPYERVGLDRRRALPVSKEEVIRRALLGKKYPPKTTRHLYPWEALPEVPLPRSLPSPPPPPRVAGTGSGEPAGGRPRAVDPNQRGT